MNSIVDNYDNYTDEELLNGMLERREPIASYFYKKYDKLVWSIARKNENVIMYISKNQYELSDLHNDIWTYIITTLEKYDAKRSSLCSWIYMVSKTRVYMIKNHFNTKKNSLYKHEDFNNGYHRLKSSPDSFINECSCDINQFFLINYNNNPYSFMDSNFEDRIVDNVFIADFVFSLVELIESCTEKEKKVYLCKLQQKSLKEICDEAHVSTSYITIVYKKLNKRFKELYDTVSIQTFTLSHDRKELAKYILGEKSFDKLPKQFNIDSDTISICRQMLEVIGLIC